MDAIHINWTKPFRNRFNAPYEVEDFEILTTILSALKWREKNGNIKSLSQSPIDVQRKFNALSSSSCVNAIVSNVMR